MDYIKAVRQAIAFIHEEIGESILISDISARVFLSPSYFAHVFRTLTGYTVKEYVNKYRIYRTANELVETRKKIITIAHENGFSSQQAMTRCFTNAYGCSPAQFRKHKPFVKPFPPDNFLTEGKIRMELKDCFKNVVYEKKKSFYVIGIETDITYNEKEGTSSIGKLYERWYGEKLIDKIPDKVFPNLVYGMTHESTENDTAKYIVCTEVSTISGLPFGFIARKFEECEFAVFETTLEMETSGQFWRYFYRTWLPENGFIQPEAVHTKKNNLFTKYPNYEVYDENFKDESSMIKIYAPIVR